MYYEYVEFISKNNQHRFKDINMESKTTRAYALPGNDRCVVKLLDAYLSLLTPGAPYLYTRTFQSFPTDPTTRCTTKQRVGVNVLKNMLPDLCEKSGIGVRYTNHSLQATAITRMFNRGIPEKVIAETSAHRSTKALRYYEQTCEQQRQAVTAVINQAEFVSTVKEETKTVTKVKKEEIEKKHCTITCSSQPIW